ncbi:trans-sialidase, partial [Trypanosoma rangeli]
GEDNVIDDDVDDGAELPYEGHGLSKAVDDNEEDEEEEEPRDGAADGHGDGEAEDAAPGAAVGSGSSPAANSDAEQTLAKDTSDTSTSATVQMSVEANGEVSQGANRTQADDNAPYEPQPASSPHNAATLYGNIFANLKNITGVRPDEGNSDSAVRGCVPRLPLLALLGLWGIAAFSVG